MLGAVQANDPQESMDPECEFHDLLVFLGLDEFGHDRDILQRRIARKRKSSDDSNITVLDPIWSMVRILTHDPRRDQRSTRMEPREVNSPYLVSFILYKRRLCDVAQFRDD